jgi:hypothetical protein
VVGSGSGHQTPGDAGARHVDNVWSAAICIAATVYAYDPENPAQDTQYDWVGNRLWKHVEASLAAACSCVMMHPECSAKSNAKYVTAAK